MTIRLRTPSVVPAAVSIAGCGAVVLAAASISGCGAALNARDTPATAARAASARSTAAALSLVRAAAAATLASSAAVEFRLDGSRALGSSPAPVFGSGEFDFPLGTGSETIDLGEVSHQEPGTEHIVFLPSRVYLQPKSTAKTVLPKGRAWMSATLAGSDSVRTNFPSFALQVEGVNPQLLLTELAAGAVAAVLLGQQTIAEGRARTYDVTVDLARALSGVSGPANLALGQAIQSELTTFGNEPSSERLLAPIRTWVDGGGHIVQMRAAPAGAGVGIVTTTMCCFGSAVAVAPPPSSQVVDITALTPSGERENNGGGDSDGG